MGLEQFASFTNKTKSSSKFKKPARKRKRRNKSAATGEIENPPKKQKIEKKQPGEAQICLSRNILLKQRKMLLILDLDYTLVHTVQFKNFAKYEDKYPDIYSYENPQIAKHLIKLRPQARKFIKTISEKFIIGFYTNGDQAYAEFVAKTLDPECILILAGVFGNPDEKSVSKFLEHWKHDDVPQHLCAIVDDRNDVWQENQRTKVQMIEPFFFWIEDETEPGFPGVHETSLKDEELLAIQQRLLEKHAKFFPGKD